MAPLSINSKMTTPEISKESQYDESEYAEDEYLDAVASDDEDSILAADQDSSSCGLPVDGSGNIALGFVLRMSRLRQKEPEPKRGLVFYYSEGGIMRQALFARSHGWVAKASREEIVLERPSFYASESPKPIASVNFHHWLVNQSKSIIVRHREWKGMEADVRRAGIGASHNFEVDGLQLRWQSQTRALPAPGESSENSGDNMLYERKRWQNRNNMECVDEEGNRYMLYSQENSESCSCKNGERHVGRFEVRRKGLSPVMVETLITAFLAVYVKLQKRRLQGSQAGWGSGLGTAVMYAIGG